MADNVGNSSGKDYRLDVPPRLGGFHVKGLSSCSWGMKNRLSRIFRPSSGNTVMLAFDHGYIMGSTSGLERLDIVIEPLRPFVDVLMATRGAMRTCVPPATDKALCLRATHDASVLHEDMSTGGGAGLDMEDALRINASALAVQTFIGASGERIPLNSCAERWTWANGTASPSWEWWPWESSLSGTPGTSCWRPGYWRSTGPTW